MIYSLHGGGGEAQKNRTYTRFVSCVTRYEADRLPWHPFTRCIGSNCEEDLETRRVGNQGLKHCDKASTECIFTQAVHMPETGVENVVPGNLDADKVLEEGGLGPEAALDHDRLQTPREVDKGVWGHDELGDVGQDHGGGFVLEEGVEVELFSRKGDRGNRQGVLAVEHWRGLGTDLVAGEEEVGFGGDGAGSRRVI